MRNPHQCLCDCPGRQSICSRITTNLDVNQLLSSRHEIFSLAARAVRLHWVLPLWGWSCCMWKLDSPVTPRRWDCYTPFWERQGRVLRMRVGDTVDATSHVCDLLAAFARPYPWLVRMDHSTSRNAILEQDLSHCSGQGNTHTAASSRPNFDINIQTALSQHYLRIPAAPSGRKP
jgi:hypothetical protein